MTYTLAVANQKGGVGKTVTATAVSAALVDQGLRVVTVDLDPQASASRAAGFDVSRPYASLYTPMREYIAHVGTPAITTVLQPLEARWALVPSHIDLAKMELDLFHAESREFVLRDLLGPLAGTVDWIVIDCPPTLGMLTVNALVAADGVLVPQIPDYVSSQGLQDLADTIARLSRPRMNPALHVAGVVLTRVRAHLAHHQAIREQIAAFCDHNNLPFLSAPTEAARRAAEADPNSNPYVEIPDSVSAADAVAEGIPLSRYKAGKEAARAYRRLAAVLAEEEVTHAV